MKLCVLAGFLCLFPIQLWSVDSLQYMRSEYAHMPRQRGFITNVYQSLSSIWGDLTQELHIIPETVYGLFVDAHQYSGVEAHVRMTEFDTIAVAEERAVSFRLERARACYYAARASTSQMHGRVPRVALCCSGGGFRAMITASGFIAGLADAGLLDCITYMAGLSGSTWCMAPWIASRKSIYAYCASLEETIAEGIHSLRDPADLLRVVRKIVQKQVYAQVISSMDLYGPLLAHTLLQDLGAQRLDATLTETHLPALIGEYPFPLYSVVATNSDPYEWFEVSPVEIGSSYLRAYAPTWAYGRRFRQGVSTNYAPEQSLGYYMGVFGSAFEVNLEDLVRTMACSIQVSNIDLPLALVHYIQQAIQVLIHDFMGQARLFPSLLPNITYKMDYGVRWRDERVLSLVDAGIDCNLPLAPLLRKARAIDVIIVLDASTDVAGAPELRRAQSYAWRHNLPFPRIDFSSVSDTVVHVFKDEHNTSCPIVIYFPLVKNPSYSRYFDPAICISAGYCSTFNFSYSLSEIQELAGLMRYTVIQQAEIIWKELRKNV